MATWSRKIISQLRQPLGVGVQVTAEAQPQPVEVNYHSFKYGLQLADRSGDVPAGYYSHAIDIETSRKDGVIRAPGVRLVEDAARDLSWLAVQTGLDFQSVLLAFSPPYLGVREAGSFAWTNWNLADGNFWVASNYGDVALFSNGSVSYARNFDSGAVELVAGMPGARTIFTAFGRVFAGGTIVENEYNILGVIWNGLEGDYRDWSGLGSGGELLVADVSQADRIVAGRLLSFDAVAVLCRRSLWVGVRTTDPARPADFQFKLIGVGCVAEPTAKTTEAGVTFLSDEGVRHFDALNAEVISSAINDELLPIDFTQIHLYKAAWNSSRRRYILTTPTATYIYQFPTSDYPKGAWFKYSLTATNVVVFAQQVLDPTWEDFGNLTWDQLGVQTWADLATPESSEAPDVIFVKGSLFGIQDESESDNFGLPLAPICKPKPDEQALVDLPGRIVLTQRFLLEYRGSGTIELIAQNDVGFYEVVVTRMLPQKAVSYTTTIDVLHSSRALGIYLRISEGNPEILKIQQVVLDNGPVLADIADEELLDEAAVDLLDEANNEVILWS